MKKICKNGSSNQDQPGKVSAKKSFSFRHFWHCHSVLKIRRMLIVLYVLNVTDGLLTYFLYRTGYFYEINYLLRDIAGNFIWILIAKVLLPTVLIAWLYYRIYRATEKQLKISNVVINIVTLSFAFINLLHLFWVGYFIYQKSLM